MLLLSDVFSDFRDLSLTNYGLDPVFFVSTPSLTLSVSEFVIAVNFVIVECTNVYCSAISGFFINLSIFSTIGVSQDNWCEARPRK